MPNVAPIKRMSITDNSKMGERNKKSKLTNDRLVKMIILFLSNFFDI